MKQTEGFVNSIQTLGAVDGPGVRFAVFLQGCPLRCVCCHNPETQSMNGDTKYEALEIAEKVKKYKNYFSNDGGITVSGGEPLCQPEFVGEIFKICHENGINTCLDTSGAVFNEKVKELLNHTDLVLLDIKYTDNESYLKNVGCDMNRVISFLEYLEGKGIDTWIRQVIIPGLNDTEENIKRLATITKRYKCIKKTELLPFKKLCEMKYESMGRVFPLKDTPEPTPVKMAELEKLLNKK